MIISLYTINYLLFTRDQIAAVESAMGLCVTPYPLRKIAYNVASILNRMQSNAPDQRVQEPIALSGARTGLASLQPESRGRQQSPNDSDVRASCYLLALVSFT